MRPGISRAVPMGILGFLITMVVLVVIRTLQSVKPAMDPQITIVFGVLVAAGFFVYGMGAVDPRMNQHAHEPEDGDEAQAHHEEAEEEGQPGQILGGYTWQVTTLTLGLLLIVVFFALLPDGPGIQIAHEPLSNVSDIGMVAIQIGSESYHFSQLTVIIGFIIVMMVSLAGAAGGMGLALFHLHQGATVVKDIDHTPLEAEPLENAPTAGAGLARWAAIAAVVTIGFAVLDTLIGTPITLEFATLSFFLSAGVVFVYSFLFMGWIIRFVVAQTQWRWLVRALVIMVAAGLLLGVIDFALIWLGLSGMSLTSAVVFNLVGLGLLIVPGRMVVAVMFAILSGILVPLFYFLLIGLIVPFAPPLLFGISASNALLITALILRPKFVTHWVGYAAGWTAQVLRRLPDALQ